MHDFELFKIAPDLLRVVLSLFQKPPESLVFSLEALQISFQVFSALLFTLIRSLQFHVFVF